MAQYDVFYFKPSDIEEFVPQKKQEATWVLFKEWCEREDLDEEQIKRTITLDINGTKVAIMGVMPVPQGGGHVWLFFSKEVGLDELLIATSCAKGFFKALKEFGYEWIQTPVRNDFRQGHKWATMLGFTKTEQQEDILEDGIKYTYWTRVL